MPTIQHDDATDGSTDAHVHSRDDVRRHGRAQTPCVSFGILTPPPRRPSRARGGGAASR